MNNSNNKIQAIESTSAIFVIVLVSMYLLANFFVGFSLPLFLAVMAISSLIVLKYPRSGIYSIVFLTFIFERFFTLSTIVIGRNEYKVYPLDVLMITVFLSIILNIIFANIKFNFKKADIFLAAFIVFTAIYFAFSVLVLKNDLAVTFSTAKNYAFYGLLYFAVSHLITTKQYLIKLFRFAFAAGIAIMGFIAYGIISGEGLWSQYTPLSTEGVRTLAFTHAFYLSMVLLGTIVHLINKNEDKKYLYILMPIWTVGIIGSMMRHLWISLAMACVFIYFYASSQSKTIARKSIAIYGILLTVVFMGFVYFVSLFPNSYVYQNAASTVGIVSHRVTSITDSQDESILWRSAVWKESLKQYEQSPVFGVGLGKKISVEIGKYKDFVEVRNIHNSFLVLFVQMGIFGTGSIFLLVFILVKNIWKKKFEDNDLDIAKQTVLAILVLQVIAFMFQPYLEANLLGIFFWINLGILRVLIDTKFKSTNAF